MNTRFLKINVSCAGRFLRSISIPTTKIEPESGLIGKSFDEWQKEAIVSTLALCNYNGRKAVKTLKISERTFYRRCNKYGISVTQLRKENRDDGNSDSIHAT